MSAQGGGVHIGTTPSTQKLGEWTLLGQSLENGQETRTLRKRTISKELHMS